jgi:hypothetical protein
MLKVRFLPLLLVLSACSIDHTAVKNQPPVLEKNVGAYASEFGRLQAKSVSVFFWPEGLNEEQSRVAARTVKEQSLKIDQILTKKAGFGQLELAFVKQQCLESWSSEVTPSGANVPWVTQWKTLEPVQPVGPVTESDAGFPEYKKYREYLALKQNLDQCMANQVQRQSMFKWVAQESVVEMQTASVIIGRVVDPETFPKQVNYKSVKAEGSIFVIAPSASTSAVQVTLRDFTVAGYSPSTENGEGLNNVVSSATYSVPFHLLSFVVPEVNADGSTTGATYQFNLERGPDFLTMARFEGEVALVRGGQVVRKGSASIMGPLLPL